MLYSDRISASEGIEVNKSSRSKECMLCHFRCFVDTGYRYEPEVCNGCNDISMMVYKLKDSAILKMKGLDYWYITWNMSRTDAIKRLNNSKLYVKGSL